MHKVEGLQVPHAGGGLLGQVQQGAQGEVLLVMVLVVVNVLKL